MTFPTKIKNETQTDTEEGQSGIFSAEFLYQAGVLLAQGFQDPGLKSVSAVPRAGRCSLAWAVLVLHPHLQTWLWMPQCSNVDSWESRVESSICLPLLALQNTGNHTTIWVGLTHGEL